MTPYPHQVELAREAYEILCENLIVYLACEERTGKTVAAMLTAEECRTIKSVLVITKKKALTGWNETIEAMGVQLSKSYTVVNYHQAYKQPQHDLVILDESHNYISTYPKPGKIWRELKPLTAERPIIYISATPHGQGLQQLYGQLALSSYSPWCQYKKFYDWFRVYGFVYQRQIGGIKANQYDRTDEKLIRATTKHLFITKTRAELGFEHEPTDRLHYINLDNPTKHVYNTLIDDNIVQLKAGLLVCDTDSKLRSSLHMLEGGAAKLEGKNVVLANREKADYILEHFGDTEDVVIMYNYQAEGIKLAEIFKHATILQATSYAEGVDLSHKAHLIIYSQDFSTARHTQRRARQANKARDTPITVHYLLVKKAASEQVYKTVSLNKRNFVDSVFIKDSL